jgi:CheY-like chemotaxis protein
MDGLEAGKPMKRQPGLSSISIIRVTTRGELQHVETAFANRCADYVTRPINGIEWLAKVKNYVGE